MDIIYLNDLKIETVIGIYDWEREIKQTVVLDLDMASDIRKAASTESIEDQTLMTKCALTPFRPLPML